MAEAEIAKWTALNKKLDMIQMRAFLKTDAGRKAYIEQVQLIANTVANTFYKDALMELCKVNEKKRDSDNELVKKETKKIKSTD